MLFNSYVFLGGFLPVALGGFGLASRFGRTAVVAWLVGLSLTFYSWWNIAFLPVLLVSIAGNFIAARLILASEGAWARVLLITAIAANLAALGWYKYLASLLVLIDLPMPFGDPVLPLGISFFTFTQIAFLIDSYQEKVDERNFLRYVLFVSFFPHLIGNQMHYTFRKKVWR